MPEAEVEAEVKTETEVKFKEAEVAEQNNLLIDYRSQPEVTRPRSKF